MGKFRVEIEKQAQKDIAKHQKSGNKSTLKKIEILLKELSEHPYTGVGQPEPLKYNLSGLWSRRITQKDRLVYEVNDMVVTVYVLSAMGHYEDK
ncbi:MAG: Txe/YoeB family addiction module toxin [Capnocytophaga sp.]|nr:Txe/YoeB family addiction module toxin [Capnocytophaga sp.]MDO5606817.1 Txe/YoeB family addiction module toxin [Capnocytophaga sp.]